jgi:hypothetical protein
MERLVTIGMLPLVALNSLGWLVGGIWLAVLGKWSVIGWGTLGIFGGSFAIGLFLLPGFLLVGLGMMVLEPGGAIRKLIAAPILASSLLWTFFLMSAWGVLMFYFLSGLRDYEGASLPGILWAYTVATAPWTYMASKENNPESQMNCVVFQIACALFGIGLYFEWVVPAIGFWIVIVLYALFSVTRGMMGLIREA